MPWRGGREESKAAEVARTSGNASRHARQDAADDGVDEDEDEDLRPQTAGEICAGRADRRRKGRRRSTARFVKSIIKLYLTKKSVPRMGLETSAKVKECDGRKTPKLRCKAHVPKVFIVVPLAALRTPEEHCDKVAGEAGYTETSAPVSMRKGRFMLRQ